jgi:hypothetical protein
MMNHLRLLLLLFSTMFIAACGGGNGNSDPASSQRTAQVKLADSGTLASNLSGLEITIALPPGVTPAVDANGALQVSVVTPSGVAANSTILPDKSMYTPQQGSNPGHLTIVLASKETGGFGIGEFAEVTLSVAAGANPLASEFVATGFAPVDLSGNTVTGLTPTVTATIQ